MLPAELALEEEGDVPHYAVARKNNIANTRSQIRHRQRFWWFAILSVRARDGLHLAVGREEGLVAARGSPIFSPKDSFI